MAQTTIDIDLPTPVGAAIKRVTHLMESGYLPESLRRDLTALIQAAMSWEISTGRTKDTAG